MHYGTRCETCRKVLSTRPLYYQVTCGFLQSLIPDPTWIRFKFQSSAQAPLDGKRFLCLICADLDLCGTCFDAGHHPQHPFACRDTPTSTPVPAERPDMMPTVTRLATLLPSAASPTTAAGSEHPPIINPGRTKRKERGVRTTSSRPAVDTQAAEGRGVDARGSGRRISEGAAAAEARASAGSPPSPAAGRAVVVSLSGNEVIGGTRPTAPSQVEVAGRSNLPHWAAPSASDTIQQLANRRRAPTASPWMQVPSLVAQGERLHRGLALSNQMQPTRLHLIG